MCPSGNMKVFNAGWAGSAVRDGASRDGDAVVTSGCGLGVAVVVGTDRDGCPLTPFVSGNTVIVTFTAKQRRQTSAGAAPCADGAVDVGAVVAEQEGDGRGELRGGAGVEHSRDHGAGEAHEGGDGDLTSHNATASGSGHATPYP